MIVELNRKPIVSGPSFNFLEAARTTEICIYQHVPWLFVSAIGLNAVNDVLEVTHG